jgi:hypothetical protein
MMQRITIHFKGASPMCFMKTVRYEEPGAESSHFVNSRCEQVAAHAASQSPRSGLPK